MKKHIGLGQVLFAVSLVLFAVSGWMLFQAYQLKTESQPGFRPLVTNATEYEWVGQMRVPTNRTVEHVIDQPAFGEFLPPVEIEVKELVPGGGTFKEGHEYDLLKVWFKDPDHPGEDFGFHLYRYCEEDGFWYAIFWPSWTDRLIGSLRTERVKEFAVPSDLLSEPGKYMIEIVNLDGVIGGCTFQLPLEN